MVSHCRGIGCGVDVLRQAACLVVGPVAVGGFAFLFGCTPVGRASDSMMVPTWGLVCVGGMVGAWCFGCLSGPPGFTCWISFAPVFGLIYC